MLDTELLKLLSRHADYQRDHYHEIGQIPVSVKRAAAQVATKLQEARMWQRELAQLIHGNQYTEP